MCLVAYLGSAEPVPPVPGPPREAPDPGTGWFHVTPVGPEHPVRRHFSTQNVVEVGSHQGCGCGFSSWVPGAELWSEVGEVEESARAELEAAQASRVRLADLVRRAAVAGPVEVYGVWSGDEGLESLRAADVDAGWFERLLYPLEERVLLRVGAA